MVFPLTSGSPRRLRRVRCHAASIAAASVMFMPGAPLAAQRPASAAPCVASAAVTSAQATSAQVTSAQVAPAAGAVMTSADAGARFATAATQCMSAMHEGMHAALASPVESADRAFAASMIPHHQGAIDMARQLLVYGEDPALRSLALGIIADQQAEVALLRQWLRAHPGRQSESSRSASVRQEGRPAERALDRDVVASPGAVPVSARDRVYTADQVSNTVSVIDPSVNRLLGVIHLGNRRPDLLSPLYKGQINVHGLGVSPDGKTLAVISTGSNGVTLIETATNRVLGTVYVGRNPHEGFFTPDGRELWVTVRGEDHVAVIDPRAMKVVRTIVTAPGPGMVVFRPDGKVAFVDHSFTPELDVVDVASHRVIRRIPVASPFSPNLAMTADGRQLWLTHKDIGKVTVIDARTFAIEGVIETGPVTNHVNFAGPGGGTRVGGAAAGDFAYVTVGGENAVKVYRRDRTLVTTIPVGAVPHGLWPSGDGTRVYVGLQQADSVAVIDTRTNTRIATVPVGQSPQALLYVVDAVPSGAGTGHLVPPGSGDPARNVVLSPSSGTGGQATVTIRALGPVDGIDVAAKGLRPSTEYTLFLAAAGGDAAAGAGRWPLATLRTDSTGKANVEAVAPTTIPRDATVASHRLILVEGTAESSRAVLEARLER